MKFELAEVITKDNLVHQGIYYEPKKSSGRAILWVHGLASRFYSDVNLIGLFAQACEENGMAFASFNNRGHDMVAGMRKVDKEKESGYTHETRGAAYEKFEESVHDIESCVSFLERRGFSEVIIVGHSSGANKVCYYASTQKDPRIAGAVLVSPMSDRYHPILPPESFQATQAAMSEKLRQGKGNELIVGAHYFPITPNRWQSLYGEKSSEDVFNYQDSQGALEKFGKIRNPMLVVFSQLDEHANRPIDEIRKVFDSHNTSKKYRSIIFSDTEHGFRGKQQELVSEIVDWASSL